MTSSRPALPDPERQPFDVLVVGGSYVGTLLALLLADKGFQVAIVDPNLDAPIRLDGKAFAVNETSLQIFDALDLGDTLRLHGSPVNGIEVAEAHLLRGVAANPLFYDANKLIGHPFGIVIESHRVMTYLREALLESSVTRIRGSVVSQDCGNADSPAHLTLEDGSTYAAWVLAACDGKNSQLREHAGLPYTAKPYPNSAIVCTVAVEHEHKGCALEYFYPTGPFAMVPLPDKRCNIIWCESHRLAKTLMNLDAASFERHLAWRANGRFGSMHLCANTKRHCFPLNVQHVPQLVAERLVLAGDAAHTIHPIAGLGVNLGFRDVYELAKTLAEDRFRFPRPGHSSTLNKYQRARRFDIDKHIAMTDAILSLFALDWPAINLVRQWGFHMTSKFPLLQRFFVGQASPKLH